MKRRLVALLAAVMLLGVGIAIAVGTIGADPMISKSYWENTYLPTLAEALQKQANQSTKALYETAAAKLERLGEADVKAAQGLSTQKNGYTPSELKTGDSLELATGASVVLYGGECRLERGVLADVTQGTELATGSVLTAHHRYVVTGSSGALLTQTKAGSLGYQGTGTRKPAEGSSQPGSENELPFHDVRPEHWYYNAIVFVYDKGYFAGTGADTFSPNAPMDRAMVATVLHRMAGSTQVTGGSAFSDVADGQWYTQGIAWASSQGVVNGMGGGRYEPHLAVTREQLVTMLYRYEKDYRKLPVSATGTLDVFPDGGAVSSWAQDAMRWAVGAGLIQGRDTGHLDPVGTASRAEVATILQRFAARG